MLTPCRSCRRHVAASDPQCPFCGAAVLHVAAQSSLPRASRAQLFAFAAVAAVAAIAGCEEKKAPVTNVASENSAVAPPPVSATATAAPSASSSGGLADLGGPIKPGSGPGLMVAAYGAPAPPPSLKGPTAELAPGPASGGVADASTVIAKARPRFRACYAKALQFDPGLEPGKVTVTMQVATTGNVKDAKVSSPASAFSSCIAGVARSLLFNPPATEQTLTVPLVFAKKD